MKISSRSSWRNGFHPFCQVRKEQLAHSGSLAFAPSPSILTSEYCSTPSLLPSLSSMFLFKMDDFRLVNKLSTTNNNLIPNSIQTPTRHAYTSSFIPHSSLLMAGQPPHHMSQNTNGLPLMYHPQPHTPFPALQQQRSNGERINLGPLSDNPPANDLESTDGSGHGSPIPTASMASPLPALVASPLPPHMLTTAAMESLNTGVSSPSNMPEIPGPRRPESVRHLNLLQIPQRFRYNMLTVTDTASHRNILEHRVVRQFTDATTSQRTQCSSPY